MKDLSIGLLSSTMVALVAFTVIFGFLKTDKAESGVDYGNEYQATLIDSSDVGTSSIKSLAGSVGSIIIASTSPVATNGPMLALYQTASTTVSTSTMTPTISFGAVGAVTPPAGEYAFDVGFSGGIYLWVNPAFNGSYTITYR